MGSMIRSLRKSLLGHENLFGMGAHKLQSHAKHVKHYYALAARSMWPAMFATIQHALSLPSGVIFDDESVEARVEACRELGERGVTAKVWRTRQRSSVCDGLEKKRSTYFLMPSDSVFLNADLPRVTCVIHFEVP